MDMLTDERITEMEQYNWKIGLPQDETQWLIDHIRTLQQQNAQMKEAITHLANWDDEIGSAKRYAQNFIQGGSQ